MSEKKYLAYVTKFGSSLYVHIPKEVVDFLKIKKKDMVEVRIRKVKKVES